MNNENKNPNVEEELKKQSQEAAENEQTTSEASEAQENASSEEKELTAEEKLGKELEEAQKVIDEQKDKYLRLSAEFDNFRKRTEKEKAAMFEVGAKSVIEKLLPTVDNFERGFASVTDEQKEDPFVQGMEKVYRQLMASLESIGVKPIEAVGQEFNPNFHNAVMHVEDEEAGENIIVEEFQKGYLYRDTVVRHSMVKVAN